MTFLVGLVPVAPGLAEVHALHLELPGAVPDDLSLLDAAARAFGLAFEVPIAVILLVRMGVITVAQLREYRGYFWVAAAVGTALVTPPDAGSMIMLLGVVGGLYEVGILAALFFVKKTRAPDAGSEVAKH